MYILIQAKILNIEGWHLVLTGIGVVLPMILLLIGFERSRRKDLQDHLKQKASVIYVDKQDKSLRIDIKKEMESHYKVHAEIGNQYTQIQSDLTLIKGYLINKK